MAFDYGNWYDTPPPASPDNVKERYLGDGVYVTYAGYDLVLDLRGQDDTRIVLEPAVWAALRDFATRNGVKP